MDVMLLVYKQFFKWKKVGKEMYNVLSFKWELVDEERVFLGYLKSLGPIDCKFHGHGENNGFV